MAYIWKYYPHNELIEGEENDIQLCLAEADRDSFLKNTMMCIEDGSFSFTVQSYPLPAGSPHHIDDPVNNLHLPHKSYTSITIRASLKLTDQIEENEKLELNLTKDSLLKLISIINETSKAPALYENKFALNNSLLTKLVSWGCYEGKPVYF